jgi:hypothetical protein
MAAEGLKLQVTSLGLFECIVFSRDSSVYRRNNGGECNSVQQLFKPCLLRRASCWVSIAQGSGVHPVSTLHRNSPLQRASPPRQAEAPRLLSGRGERCRTYDLAAVGHALATAPSKFLNFPASLWRYSEVAASGRTLRRAPRNSTNGVPTRLPSPYPPRKAPA